MKEDYLSERGIYYRTNDFKGGRPTLVFVHGLLGSSSAWAPYEKLLQGNYNILTFDLRGHGKSVRPLKYREYEVRYFVKDIAALLEHLHITECVLVSHSFGTLIALQYLLAHPRMVKKAIFMAPIYGTRSIRLVKLTHYALGAICSVLWLFSSTKSGEHLDYARFTPTSDWAWRRILLELYSMGPRSYFYALAHIYKARKDSDWQHITVPTLLIHGKRDSIIPVNNALHLATKIPHATLELINPANHQLVINNVPEVTKAIEGFV